MDDFEFDDDAKDQKRIRGRSLIGTTRSTSLSLSVCSHSSTISGNTAATTMKHENGNENRKKRHRLNHGSSALSCRADPALSALALAVASASASASASANIDELNQNDQDSNSEATIANANINVNAEPFISSHGINDSVRHINYPSHESSTNSSKTSTHGGKRQTRRRKTHVSKNKKDSTLLTNNYFSSSPLMFSSPSSFLSSIKSSTASSMSNTTTSIDKRSSTTTNINTNINNNPDNDENLEIEIQSEGKFGTPPGSPSQQPRNRDHAFPRESMPAPNSRSNNLMVTSNASVDSLKSNDSAPFSHKASSCGNSIVSQRSNRSHASSRSYQDQYQRRGRAQRSKGRTKSTFSRDNDNDDEEDLDDEPSPQSSHANSSIISYESERVMTGAGTDMYAVQDAGSYRLMLDDCTYFCSSFLSRITMVKSDITRNIHDNGSDSGNCNGNTTEIDSKKHCTITADSACDLAIMLTSKKTRGVLMTMSSLGSKGAGMGQQSVDSVDNNAFIHVLKVIGHIPQSIIGSYLPLLVAWSDTGKGNYYNEDEEIFIDWNNVISMNSVNEESVTERKEIGSDTAANGPSSFGKRRTKNARRAKDAPNQMLHAQGSVFDTAVTHALAIAAHFISLDCTFKNNLSASPSAAVAKTFRRELLRNNDFMRGVARLLIADHIVSCILENTNPTAKDASALSVSAKDAPQDEKDAINCEENSISDDKIVADPTSRGRKKKRKRKFAMVELNFDSIPEENLKEESKSTQAKPGRGGFDFFSDEASNYANSVQSSSSAYSTNKIPSRLKRKIASAQSKIDATTINNIIEIKVQDTSCIFCGDLSSAKQRREANPGNLALDTFNRILSGKMDGEDEEPQDAEEQSACSDDGVDSNVNEEGNSLDVSMESDDDGVESANLNNPMIFKNVMIRRSGAIPFLARAIAETLESCIAMSMQSQVGNGKCCTGCIHYLKDRLLRLSSIIDSLCCMSKSNRKMFCRIARKSQQCYEPYLIPALLRSVLQFSAPSLIHTNPVFADIGLAALRTLTSLTHENPVASTQFYALSITKPASVSTSSETFRGVEMILNLLHQLVEDQSQAYASQHIYDSIIFCLNSLTNVLESHSFTHVCKMLLGMSLISNEKEQKSISALSWITHWIVSQTESFRDAVMSGSPGNNGNKDDADGRNLEHHEDEFLVTSGNGFILLSYLLGAHPMTAYHDDSTRIQIKNLILNELPENSNKLILVINTLKAFCNFYRYSIGDLSVAVIAPVLKLIEGLEQVSIDD